MTVGCCLGQWIFQDNAKIAFVVLLDKGKYMTSKEVNVLSDLIFAELSVNEVEKESLSLKQLVKKQSAKTNNIYSNYNEITSGVPH